jgi:Holliday junction resolvasome RuvABC endonuclease subunit
MDDGGTCISGVGDFRLHKDGEPGRRFLQFREFLQERLAWLKPDLVVFEQAFVMPRGATTAIFFGLIAVLQAECFAHAVETKTVNAMTLKKWTTGYGRATKALMLEHVNKRWKTITHGPSECIPTCTDPAHDEADAIAVLHYAMEHLT